MKRQVFVTAAVVLLCLCAVAGSIISLRWPLMGDTTYMHYAVRLIHAGMRPYADLVEMNMPGTYLLESIAVSIFGSTGLGWRIFDLLISCIAALCITHLAPTRMAGLAVSSLLYCIHLQDGVMMGGERDYSLTVLLLAATASLLSESSYGAVGCGLLIGASVCIKPTALVFVVPIAVWLCFYSRKYLSLFLISIPAVPILCAIWLWHLHALEAFRNALTGLVAYHASIDNQPIWYLITHASSPVGFLVLLWLIGSFIERKVTHTQLLVRSLAICGWITYAVQRKGFSYQRYPFVAFFLLVLAMELPPWFRERRSLKTIAALMLLLSVGSAFLAIYRVASYDQYPPETLLASDIAHFNTTGKAQCMDTAGGCIAAMEKLTRIQSTGLIYDCYLTRANNPVGNELRRKTLAQFEADPPQTLVMTNSVCLNEPRSFLKYQEWPEFDLWLGRNYKLVLERNPTRLEHYWSRRTLPFAWRIYVHSPSVEPSQ